MVEGINLEVIWFDQDVIEVVCACSNGYFSGWAEVYLSHDDLPSLANTLRGFPSSRCDTRQVELGTFNPAHADGGVRLDFHCRDSVGHAVVEVKLRGDGCKGLGEVESVALRLAVEAAAIDAFVLELTSMGSAIGASARLAMAH